MLGFLTLLGTATADPLSSAVAAEAFLRTLPRDDPIATQRAVCGALADPTLRGSPSTDRLQALLALDKGARVLVDALLVNCTPGNPQSPLLGTQCSQAAFELCQSFGRAHGQFLRSMRDSPRSAGWGEYLPYVVLRLLQHRQVELLLRPFADERLTWFPWKEVHEAYRFAQSRELLHYELPVNRCHSPSASETTLEREYIHLLLQDLMNGGHFPPNDAFWISQSIPRWSRAAALKSQPARSAEDRFVVDLDGDEGLARTNRELSGACLSLDTAPVLASIIEEITRLREAPGRPIEGSSLGRERQLKLLRKLSALCAPERPMIARRGERKPISLTVEVAVGMSQILSELRDEQPATVSEPQTTTIAEDSTVTASGGHAEVPAGATTVTQWPTGGVNAARSRLTMVDRSDSGCRLHGPTLGMNPIMPGVLIAFREGAASPWTLAVVRRVKKRLAGKRVEMGVEYLAKDPRRIIVVSDSDTSPAGSPRSVPSRFAALFLPESATHPVLPIKTLILPACGFAPDDRLSVRSLTDPCTIQLKEPLEEQADFIWSPFEILDRAPKVEAPSVEATSMVP